MKTPILVGLLVAGLADLSWAAGPDVSIADAVKAGDSAAVRALVQRKANVNEPQADGMTALHWAARNDDLATARLLLRAGAKADAVNRFGLTPVAMAAQNGSGAMLELLLKAGGKADTANAGGETPLMTAARTGSVPAIKALAAHGAQIDTREKVMGESALMWAAAENHAEAARVLLELGADVNAQSKALTFPEFKWSLSGMVSTALPRGGWTPLMHAARQGSMEAATVLANASGANLNVRDPDGTTALVVAIQNAHYDLAAMLLDQGADPNVADSTGTAALYALVDMNTLAPMQGRPAPKLVDKIDAPELAAKLIAKGANPNQKLLRPTLGRYHGSGDASLGEGTTPFLRAAKAVDLTLMRVLMDGGADPTLTKKDRTNAAMLVAAGLANRGYLRETAATPASVSIEALKLLMSKGVDINAFNTGGETAMHIAAGRGLESVVAFLAENGARVTPTDKRGRTPLDMALGVGANTRNAPPPEGLQATAALLRRLASTPTASRQ
jgi:ankyrin repeat protein